MNIKIDQTMSEFQLAQALKKIVKEVLGVRDVKNTSRNAIAKINEALGEKLDVEMNKNKSLTNLIKDAKKLVKEGNFDSKKPTIVSVNGSTVFPLSLEVSYGETVAFDIQFSHEYEPIASDFIVEPASAGTMAKGPDGIWAFTPNDSAVGSSVNIFCIGQWISKVNIQDVVLTVSPNPFSMELISANNCSATCLSNLNKIPIEKLINSKLVYGDNLGGSFGKVSSVAESDTDIIVWKSYGAGTFTASLDVKTGLISFNINAIYGKNLVSVVALRIDDIDIPIVS